MNDLAWPQPVSGRTLDLLITAHFVFAGQVGGAEHMLYNLVRGLTRVGAEPRVLCADAGNLDADFVAELRARGPQALVGCGGGTGSRFLAEQRACLRPGLSADATLFSNYFVPPIVPRRMGRVAVVLHDMQFRHFPQHFAAKKRAWLLASQTFAMHRADRVIAISEFVRNDLLERYGGRFERKITAIPNPISWGRFGAGSKARPIERPYILSVAAHYGHKNLEILIEGFADLARSEPDLMLVLCGQEYGGLRGVKPGAAGRLGARVRALGLEDRVRFTGYLDDVSLGDWYRHALVFAFPSLFEGFGMPPVEALGFGTPTLTTARTALPEVTMGMAHYVAEPTRAAAWSRMLRDMVRHPGRYRPGDASVARLRQRYSPVEVARQYLAALDG